MASQVLSIDVRDDVLCAACVEQQGGELLVHACAQVPVRVLDDQSLEVAVDDLLDRLGENIPSLAVIGLPLALASLRNLHLPFSERKKIAQVLPLELEEQLLAPVDQYILDFTITGQQEEGGSVLVAAVRKQMLAGLIEALAGRGCRLKKIFLTVEVLCHACMQTEPTEEPVLFLCGDSHAVNLALWHRDRVVFMRRIVWPESFFAQVGMDGSSSTVPLNGDMARNAISTVCEQIQVSLYYATRGWQDAGRPVKAVLAGPMTDFDFLPPLFADRLEMDVSVWRAGQNTPGVALDTAVQQQWKPDLIGSAIELARAMWAKRKKTGLLNFLRGEFAPGTDQYFSRKRLVAVGTTLGLLAAGLLVFLWTGAHRLDSRAAALLTEMQSIYAQVFPDGAKEVKRPYLFMQSKMREMEGAEVSLPLFSENKRVLDILADISARIPDDISLKVSRLVVDSKDVQLKGTTDAFNNVDLIKNSLAASGRYTEVKIVSATADKKKGKVRFEIHLQLGEAS